MIDFKKLRVSNFLRQETMADALGMTQSAYSRLERGEWTPTKEKEEKMIDLIKNSFPEIDLIKYIHPNNKESRVIGKASISGINHGTVIGAFSAKDIEPAEITLAEKEEIGKLREEIKRKDALIAQKDAFIAQQTNLIEKLLSKIN